MNTTQRAGLLQRWSVVHTELLPERGLEVEGLTPKLTKLIHTLEWARIEEFVPGWQGIGRPPQDRSALANGFVAKAVLGLPTTVALIERLTVDRALRRICGYSRRRWLSPSPRKINAVGISAGSWLLALEEAAGRGHLLPCLCRVCPKPSGRAGA